MKPSKPKKTVSINKSDLKALVFWADYGVGQAHGGSYMKIVKVLDTYRKIFRTITKPKFGKYL